VALRSDQCALAPLNVASQRGTRFSSSTSKVVGDRSVTLLGASAVNILIKRKVHVSCPSKRVTTRKTVRREKKIKGGSSQ